MYSTHTLVGPVVQPHSYTVHQLLYTCTVEPGATLTSVLSTQPLQHFFVIPTNRQTLRYIEAGCALPKKVGSSEIQQQIVTCEKQVIRSLEKRNFIWLSERLLELLGELLCNR
jgi:hypothetical protein